MSNLEQQCNNLLIRVQNFVAENRYESAYSTLLESLSVIDLHYKEAPLYKKIGNAVCYRIFKAYIFGSMGLVNIMVGAHETAIELLLKGLHLCPHSLILQRLVLSNLKLGFINEAHKYLRMLHHPPIVDDTAVLPLPGDVHPPSADVYALEALFYVHVRDVSRAISACMTGMSLLAEEVQSWDPSYRKNLVSGTDIDGTDEANGTSGTDSLDIQSRTLYRNRVCIHALSLCEAMNLAAQLATATPYPVNGCIEIVLETLLQTVPKGVIEGNRILDCTSLANLAFMTFIDHGGDPLVPGRRLNLVEVITDLFLLNFKYAYDSRSIPIKCAPFLSSTIFTEQTWKSLAKYSEVYKKAVVSRGVALMDRSYAIIKSSTLTGHIEQVYGLLFSATVNAIVTAKAQHVQQGHSSQTDQATAYARASSHEYHPTETDSTQLSPDTLFMVGSLADKDSLRPQPRPPYSAPAGTAAKKSKNTKPRKQVAQKLQPRDIFRHNSNIHPPKPSLSIRAASKQLSRAQAQLVAEERTKQSVKKLMDSMCNNVAESKPNASMPIVTKNAKLPQQGLSFIPHAGPRTAMPIREIDTKTQVVLERVEVFNGTACLSPEVHNLYTNKISTCPECAYSTPMFTARRLRDEDTVQSAMNLDRQIKESNIMRNSRLGGLYKNELERSMTGMLRERIFLESALAKVEKGGIKDFAFLKDENLHLIDRRIQFNGSIRGTGSMTDKASEAQNQPHSLQLSQSSQSRPQSRTHSRAASVCEVPAMNSPYTFQKSDSDSVSDTGSVSVSASMNESLTHYQASTAGSLQEYQAGELFRNRSGAKNDEKSQAVMAIPTKYIKRLMAKSSKKAKVSSNTAYQTLMRESRFCNALGELDGRSSDDLNGDDPTNNGVKAYTLDSSASSPSPSPEITFRDGLPSSDIQSLISLNPPRSETAALALNIVSRADDAASLIRNQHAQSGKSITPVKLHTLEESSLSFVSSPHTPSPPVPTRTLRHATADFYGTPTLDTGRHGADRPVSRRDLLAQKFGTYGYLIDSLRLQDSVGPNTTEPDQTISALQAANEKLSATALSTTHAAYSNALLKKIALDQSARLLTSNAKDATEGSIMPTYTGSMRMFADLAQDKHTLVSQALQPSKLTESITYPALPYVSQSDDTQIGKDVDANGMKDTTPSITHDTSDTYTSANGGPQSKQTHYPSPSPTVISSSPWGRSKRVARSIDILRDAEPLDSTSEEQPGSNNAATVVTGNISPFDCTQSTLSGYIGPDTVTAALQPTIPRTLRPRKKIIALESVLVQDRVLTVGSQYRLSDIDRPASSACQSQRKEKQRCPEARIYLN